MDDPKTEDPAPSDVAATSIKNVVLVPVEHRVSRGSRRAALSTLLSLAEPRLAGWSASVFSPAIG